MNEKNDVNQLSLQPSIVSGSELAGYSRELAKEEMKSVHGAVSVPGTRADPLGIRQDIGDFSR